MPSIKIELDAHAELGECPRWNGREQRLYWVDIARRTLHRFDPRTAIDEYRQFDAPVGCFAFCRDGGMILAMQSGFFRIDSWDGKARAFGEQIFAGDPDRRFNDGRTDPQGRFWAGSVNTAKSAANAALYRLDGTGGITLIEGGMMTCNGAAFDVANARFYHADTPTHAIRRYDYDAAAGGVTHRTIFHQFPIGHGRPDGGSVDMEGCYWTALFDGGKVVRLAPDGTIVDEMLLPTSRPTMIAFGGHDLRTAYVTTARQGLSARQLAQEPHAGALFSFPVDVPGVGETDFMACV
jgi:sugar lactone lactonase YvrE